MAPCLAMPHPPLSWTQSSFHLAVVWLPEIYSPVLVHLCCSALHFCFFNNDIPMLDLCRCRIFFRISRFLWSAFYLQTMIPSFCGLIHSATKGTFDLFSPTRLSVHRIPSALSPCSEFCVTVLLRGTSRAEIPPLPALSRKKKESVIPWFCFCCFADL